MWKHLPISRSRSRGVLDTLEMPTETPRMVSQRLKRPTQHPKKRTIRITTQTPQPNPPFPPSPSPPPPPPPTQPRAKALGCHFIYCFYQCHISNCRRNRSPTETGGCGEPYDSPNVNTLDISIWFRTYRPLLAATALKL